MIPPLSDITISPWVVGFVNGLGLGLFVGGAWAMISSLRGLVISETALVQAHLLEEAIEAAEDEGYYDRIEPRLDERLAEVELEILESRRNESLLTTALRRVIGR